MNTTEKALRYQQLAYLGKKATAGAKATTLATLKKQMAASHAGLARRTDKDRT